MGFLSPDVTELLKEQAGACVAAIGTFDGVHRGHRRVLMKARSYARTRGLLVTAVTFSPRPEAVFRPGSALPDIEDVDTRRARLLDAGADRVVILPFCHNLAKVTDAEFLDALCEHLGMQAVCVGADFTLGRGRQGTPQRIRELGHHLLEVKLVPGHDGKLSSSTIRAAIAAGASRETAVLRAQL